MLLLTILTVIYIVWSMQQYIRKRAETELIRYQEPWHMATLMADEAARADC
jgi:hypothetical protein